MASGQEQDRGGYNVILDTQTHGTRLGTHCYNIIKLCFTSFGSIIEKKKDVLAFSVQIIFDKTMIEKYGKIHKVLKVLVSVLNS